MKTVFIRKFFTRNIIVLGTNDRNYKLYLKYSFDTNFNLNAGDKIKLNVLDEEPLEIKNVTFNLDEGVREILLQAKQIDVHKELEFLSEIQKLKENGWYE